VIRSNLSTRPFYNSKAVTLWLAVAAVVVIAATIFNVTRVMRYSGSNTELALQAEQDEAAAKRLRGNAQALRASVDPRQVDVASRDAREANALIDRRTLSWTALFNRFEATLPGDVRITAVRPEVDDKGRMLLNVMVYGRSVEDIDQFMERLDATSAFLEVRSMRERAIESGQIESQLEMIYAPHADVPPGPGQGAR
jgi:hypothetical protein